MATFLQGIVDRVPLYLSRYHSHPLFDDLVQEGRIAAAIAAERFRALPEERRETYCLMRAYNAALNFLASPRNLYRSHGGSGRPEAKVQEVPFSQLDEATDQDAIWRRVKPDFAPGLISDLWAAGVIDRLCRTPREREIMIRHVYRAESYEEIAQSVGGFKQGVLKTRQRITRRYQSEEQP